MANEANVQLGITYLTEGQAQKEVSSNTAWDILAKSSVSYLSKSVAGSSNVTLTADEWRNRMFEFTGAITANIAVIVPVTTRFFVVYNNTSGAFTLTVRTSAGTGVAVTQGTRVILLNNGTDVFGVSAGVSAYTDEQAQDAVGAMLGVSLVYVDATPLLARAALTGDVTAPQDSNATTFVQASANFAWTGDISPTQITANQNDYNPAGLSTAALLRLSTDASRDLTGIVGGADGRILGLLNIGSFPLVLKDDVTSTAANRFQLNGDITLNADEGILLWYDSTSSRWRCLGLYKVPGTTQGKHTIWVPVSAMTPATTNGAVAAQIETATAKNNFRVLQFADGATALYAHFQIAMPKAWDEGTVTFTVYWTLNSTSTNSAVFGLQGVATSNDDALDTSYGTAQTVTDAGLGVARDLHVTSESSAITIAGTPVAEDMIDFRFFRDPTNVSDTLAATAEVIGIKLYYTTNADTDA